MTGLKLTLSGSKDLGNAYSRIVWILWLILLVTIPFSTSSLVISILGYTLVSPLSLLPLGMLTFLWLAPYVLRGGRISGLFKPLSLLLFIAVLAALLSAWKMILPIKGLSPAKEMVTALGTLVIGLLFYLCAATLPNSNDRVQSSLKALYVGALLMLIWSTVQATYVLTPGRRVPLVLNNIHHIFTVRDLIYNRVTGWSYEPSWLGNLLVVLYIPLWLGSVLTRWSAFTRKRTHISVELLLLLWGLFILYLTKSRISFVSLSVMMIAIYFSVSWKSAGIVSKRITSQIKLLNTKLVSLFRLVWILASLVIVVGFAISAVWLLSRVDKRLSQLPELPGLMVEIRARFLNEAFYEVSNRLAFAERTVYWSYGYRTFENHPIFGVGLGNSGNLFNTNVPAYGYQLIEVQQNLSTATPFLVNPKNLWVRLLAETGLVGFSAFVTWLILIALAAYWLWRDGTHLQRTLGVAGIFAVLSQVIEGFSMDTFALPQYWIIFGLVTAAIYINDTKGPKKFSQS